MELQLTGRVLVPGEAEARLRVYTHPVSFYGELEEGFDEPIILLAPATRGSTVAPYVIYRLARRRLAPRAILLAGMAEPMVVAGCVLARIPLVDRLGIGRGTLSELAKRECVARVVAGSLGGRATIAIRCR